MCVCVCIRVLERESERARQRERKTSYGVCSFKLNYMYIRSCISIDALLAGVYMSVHTYTRIIPCRN